MGGGRQEHLRAVLAGVKERVVKEIKDVVGGVGNAAAHAPQLALMHEAPVWICQVHACPTRILLARVPLPCSVLVACTLLPPTVFAALLPPLSTRCRAHFRCWVLRTRGFRAARPRAVYIIYIYIYIYIYICMYAGDPRCKSLEKCRRCACRAAQSSADAHRMTLVPCLQTLVSHQEHNTLG